MRRKNCPEMMQCRGRLSEFSYCWAEDFTDPQYVVVQKLGYSVLGSNHVAALGYPASEGHLFAAKGKFVDFKGNVFDTEKIYLHGGCKGRTTFMLNKGTKIRTYPEVINLSHLWGHNFYHLVGEMLPRMFQVRDFIAANPHIPILLKTGTRADKLFQLLKITEPPPIIFIGVDETVYVEKVYFPLKVACGKSSHAVWEEFRQFFFKESVPSIIDSVRPTNVTDLKIVVARRLASRRIVGFDDLVASLEKKFPGKVVVFNGNEGQKGSVDIFSGASIYVASHGAGLTNMAFMPYNAVVLELLPDQYHNHCFGHMASALQLQYHMIVGSGKKRTELTVDLKKVVNKVEELATQFH